MQPSGQFLSPSEAAAKLGVSVKALRLYEQRGLVAPVRTQAGWRAYGPGQMARAGEIVALRALGLSLAQIASVLDGETGSLGPALAVHQSVLEARILDLTRATAKVRALRADIASGKLPAIEDLARLTRPTAFAGIGFDLPWPWGGERFELGDIRALTYIVGPLGSGKTRFARRLAEALPGTAFLGLERAADAAAFEAAPALRMRVDCTLAWLEGDGARMSEALSALVAALEDDRPAALVVDMVEQGLDHATQEALMAHLRRREPAGRPLFLMTRSSAILDLSTLGPDEAVIFCPPNHSPPFFLAPWPGAPGHEAAALCLATPEVRARTEGVIAWQPDAACRRQL